MARKPRVPSYRHHKPSGQAVVTIQGVDHYLGKYDSPESHTMYRRLIAEYLGTGSVAPVDPDPVHDLTVTELLDRYWTFAEGYYANDGTTTSQLVRIRSSLAFVRELYGDVEARRFGPVALRAVRQRMIENGYVRRLINQMMGTVKRVFSWGVSHELIPPSVSQGLRTVEGLRRGKTDARESEPVKPVPEDQIEPVKRAVLPVVADLIDLQLLTATRPGEIVRLKDVDLDRSREVWVYQPGKHKTAHHGHRRTILIGPRGQAILNRYLTTDKADYYLFSPYEAILKRWAEKGRPNAVIRRKTHIPGEFYKPTSYCHAIWTACRKLGIDPTWHPHQLRHNAATRIVAEFGWEVARVILGHRHVDTTRIYAEDDLKKAAEAVKKLG